MRNLACVLAAVAVLSVVPSCAVEEDAIESDRPGLDDDFARASRATGVPADLLAAVSYVETQWQMVTGEQEHEGRPAGVGLFALWGDNALPGYDLTDPADNIMAAATRLAQLAAAQGLAAAGDDLTAWTPVLLAYSQNPDDASRY